MKRLLHWIEVVVLTGLGLWAMIVAQGIHAFGQVELSFLRNEHGPPVMIAANQARLYALALLILGAAFLVLARRVWKRELRRKE